MNRLDHGPFCSGSMNGVLEKGPKHIYQLVPYCRDALGSTVRS